MVRIADRIAQVRMLYPSPMTSAPSVLVIDVPRTNRGVGLPLDRYYSIIIETDEEAAEVERFLTEPRPAPWLPNLLNHRPSSIWTKNILISRYEPPAAGWPWLIVSRWPDAFKAMANRSGVDMARGCYTFEMLARADEADRHCVALLETLGSRHEISVRLLSAGTVATPGTA
jgi:hypothetical protein